jgi:UDP-N-acetylglucosamine 2-epimerase (non-hydrolysing)/UDP-N-acetylglucosamine 2-epimerase (hydrolysing)
MARTFLTCVGTRPEIIKMAMLHRALEAAGHKVVVLHTGQHNGMAHGLYRFFDMQPDIEVEIERTSSSLALLTAQLLEGIDKAVESVRPDIVLVQGDTTSALAAALAAYYHRRPVAHIEAGLRTYEREPFPEEKNREVIGRLARWHFAPTPQARQNLLSEGIGEQCIHEVGNTGIDAALWARDGIRRRDFRLGEFAPESVCRFLERHRDRPLVLVTAHRRENWGQPISNIARAVASLLAANRDAVAVWPVHPNPRVGEDIDRGLEGVEDSVRERIQLTGPLEYPAMIALLSRCRFTLTDSGGVQEEASALAAPVLIARDSTERQELVEAGGAILVGDCIETVVREGTRLIADDAAHRAMQVRSCPFGDGRASERIARVLA